MNYYELVQAEIDVGNHFGPVFIAVGREHFREVIAE